MIHTDGRPTIASQHGDPLNPGHSVKVPRRCKCGGALRDDGSCNTGPVAYVAKPKLEIGHLNNMQSDTLFGVYAEGGTIPLIEASLSGCGIYILGYSDGFTYANQTPFD